MRLLALILTEHSNGQIVLQQLENTAKRTGIPREILSDHGSDVKSHGEPPRVRMIAPRRRVAFQSVSIDRWSQQGCEVLSGGLILTHIFLERPGNRGEPG